VDEPSLSNHKLCHSPLHGLKGIRYGSAPDGLKCHEYQYWDALEFDSAGHAKPLHYKVNFTLDLPAPVLGAEGPTADESSDLVDVEAMALGVMGEEE
jgi:hypothetical protein